MKRPPTEWENVFANDISDKGLISKIYKNTHSNQHQTHTHTHTHHTNGQQAQEKTLNITDYQRNANQNHNELINSHLSERLLSKRQQITIASEDVEKGNPCTLLVGMQIGVTTMENSREIIQKMKK